MPSFRALPCPLLVLAVTAASALAQTPATSVPAEIALGKARARYYTPVDTGLGSFQCDVRFDWKDFMQKATHQALTDDDARLKYLQSIHLTIEDNLRGSGELHWTAPTTAPEGTEDSISKIREGMQQIWSGFFQSWNSFMTGDLVTVDRKATAERTPTGYRMAVQTGPSVAEEFFNTDLLLQTVHVVTPTLDSTVLPTFAPTARGLQVTAINSSFRQPPTAEPTTVSMQLQYAPVASYDLPSALVVTVGPARFDYHLVNCTTQAALAPK